MKYWPRIQAMLRNAPVTSPMETVVVNPLSERAGRRVAWGAWVTCVLLVVGDLVLVFARPTTLLSVDLVRGFASATVGVSFPTVGLLLISKRRGGVLGWLLIGIGLSLGLAAFVGTYDRFSPSLRSPGALPGANTVAWVETWSFVPGEALLAPFLLLFPSGHLPSRRWRIAVWAVGIGTAIALVTAPWNVTGPSAPSSGVFPGYHNPFGISYSTVANGINGLGQIIGGALVPNLAALLAAGSLVPRLRRSRGTERQQLKWFVFTGVGMLVFYVGGNLGVSFVPSVAVGMLAIIGAPLLPVGIAIAVLRYRLYDIDRIISRTLSYAAITIVLAAVYVLIALVPTVLVGTGHSPSALIAAATLVAAALFRPVRRSVQNVVDHRFNRARYDAERTMNAFTARLRDEVDIETLRGELLALVSQTMQPERAELWLRPAVERRSSS